MAPDSISEEQPPPSVHIPVARSKALIRALVRGVLALALGVVTLSIYGRLNFRPSGVSNRIVDYSIAFCTLPLAAATLVSAAKALRWLLLGAWPRETGVHADADELVFRLGPFGGRRYDAQRLEVHYPFELESELEDGGFEAFLPEEQQRATLLPRIAHAETQEKLNLAILRYTGISEVDAAKALRPLLDLWRQRRLDLENQADTE